MEKKQHKSREIMILVGGWATPLKSGMMTFPTEWEKMFQTTNQDVSKDLELRYVIYADS